MWQDYFMMAFPHEEALQLRPLSHGRLSTATYAQPPPTLCGLDPHGTGSSRVPREAGPTRSCRHLRPTLDFRDSNMWRRAEGQRVVGYQVTSEWTRCGRTICHFEAASPDKRRACLRPSRDPKRGHWRCLGRHANASGNSTSHGFTTKPDWYSPRGAQSHQSSPIFTNITTVFGGPLRRNHHRETGCLVVGQVSRSSPRTLCSTRIVPRCNSDGNCWNC